jgi:putative polyketide hydroxylase
LFLFFYLFIYLFIHSPQLSAWIADKYSSGRVFLAGDAAHTLPPSRGGYGANTGIDDAHNLAWKLAAVLQGEAQEGLLDTYDAERRPIGKLRYGFLTCILFYS